MEQDVKENEVLLLRFKYHSFFDLNPKVCPIDKRYNFTLLMESLRTRIRLFLILVECLRALDGLLLFTVCLYVC